MLDLVSKEIINDMNLAREVLLKTNDSIVVIKNNKILAKKMGSGIKPIIEIIDEMKNSINGAVLGDRILGKASALLSRFAKVNGVYSPKATKKAIAILILAGIPNQIDKMVPYLKNKNGDDICPFEKLLDNIDSPDEAFFLLKEKNYLNQAK